MLGVRRAALLLAGLCAAACATTPDQLVRRPWIEVRSANFSIFSTLPEPEAHVLLEQLEVFRATVARLTSARRLDPRVPTEIYAFASQGEYFPFSPDRNVAGFFMPGLRSNRVALIASGARMDPGAIVTHEYTHFLVRNQDHLMYPAWYDEGFAEFLSSTSVRDGKVWIGLFPQHRMSAFRYLPFLSWPRIISASDFRSWPEEEIQMFYAQSWLLVHYLNYGRPEAEGPLGPPLTRYLSLLEEGRDPGESFESAFGMDFAELERRITRYQRSAQARGIARSDLEIQPFQGTRRVPSDEIGVRLGWLALAGRDLELADGLFAEAIAANPSNSRGWAGRGDVAKFSERFEDAEAAYAKSLELGPDDWENHLEIGEYFLERAREAPPGTGDHNDRARHHLQKVTELAPSIPEGHAMLGMSYMLLGTESQAALESLERAYALLPSHPAIQLPLAELYVHAGDRERAVPLLRRVIQWSESQEAAGEARRLLKRIERERGSALE